MNMSSNLKARRANVVAEQNRRYFVFAVLLLVAVAIICTIAFPRSDGKEQTATTTVQSFSFLSLDEKESARAARMESNRLSVYNGILETNPDMDIENITTLSYNVVNAAEEFGISPFLLAAVVKTESSFHNLEPNDVSAKGYAQVTNICRTEAARHGYNFDERTEIDNLRCSAWYLSYLTNTFGDNEDYVIAGYNAGITAVLDANGVPDYPETQDYVRKVKSARARIASL